MRKQMIARFLLAAAVGIPNAASAQEKAVGAAPAALAKMCAEAASSEEPSMLAQRAYCLISRVVPSEDRIEQARELSRRALRTNEPAGGTTMYLAFANDPQYQYVRTDGSADLAAYNRLAGMPITARGAQIEAIDALGFALGKGHRDAVSAFV